MAKKAKPQKTTAKKAVQPKKNKQDTLPQDSAKASDKQSKNYRDAVAEVVNTKDVNQIVQKARKDDID